MVEVGQTPPIFFLQSQSERETRRTRTKFKGSRFIVWLLVLPHAVRKHE